MIRSQKPKALRPGDVIGLAAPASPPATEDHLARGIHYLERLGYRVELGAHVYHRRGYLAGSDDLRADDLNRLFSNRKVKAIFTVRGGYGSMRLLPLLDYPMIRKNPKILLGYSDITALQNALFAKTGLVTFSGPMVAVEMASGLRGKAEEQLWRCLTSTRAPGKLRLPLQTLKTYGKGVSVGTLLGGNLSLIAAMVGSDYFPGKKDVTWLMEEVDERPYRIDRTLFQLKRANLFRNSSGILLGRFIDCKPAPGKPSLTLHQVFKDMFDASPMPVVGHLHYGHVKNTMTLPLGVRVKLSAERGSVELLESGVEA